MTKPIKIRNPISLQHLVRVKPGQTIEVELDHEKFPDHRIVFIPNNSLFFKQKILNEDSTIYSISYEQVYDTWSNYSSLYMGEVWIESKKESSRLIVFLECTNDIKSNFLTVINPDYIDLRTTPGDIIEIILFNSKSEQEYFWEWQFEPETDSDVELLGDSVFDLHYCFKNKTSLECCDFLYSRCPRTVLSENSKFYQYHFWFRFDKKLLSLMDELNGINLLGNFKFVGTPKNAQSMDILERALCVYSSINKKHKMRVFHSLLIPKHNENCPIVSNFSCQKNDHKLVSYNKNKDKFFIRDVDIKLIETRYLDQGCFTKSASPPDRASSKSGVKNICHDSFTPYNSNDFDII